MRKNTRSNIDMLILGERACPQGCAPPLALHRMAGVTLIELVMTVAIASILMTLAVPSFQSMLAKNRVAGLTNELSAALQLARSEAVKRGKRVTVCKCTDPTATTPACDTATSAAWTNGWLVFVDGNTTGVIDGSGTSADTLVRVGQPSTLNAIQAGTNFVKSLSYFPSGVSSGTGDDAARTLTLCLAPEQRKIIIGRTGQVRIEKGSCT